MPSRSACRRWAVVTSSTEEMRTRSRPSRSNHVTCTLASGWSWPPKRLCFTRAPFATPFFLPYSRVRKVTIRSRSCKSRTSRISASAVCRPIVVILALRYAPARGPDRDPAHPDRHERRRRSEPGPGLRRRRRPRQPQAPAQPRRQLQRPARGLELPADAQPLSVPAHHLLAPLPRADHRLLPGDQLLLRGGLRGL